MIERLPRLPTAMWIGFGRSAISLISAALNVRQAENPVELQLQLVLIEIPEALAETAEIASADLVEPRLDHADFTVVVEIELECRQRERHDRGEQQHGGEKTQTNAAASPVEHPRKTRSRESEVQSVIRSRSRLPAPPPAQSRGCG